MKCIINPEFHHMEKFLKRLPAVFESEGRTIYKSRNEIKIFEVEGLILNVKSYKKPIFANRVIYTFFRKSKSRRAYENALEIKKKGFDTPEPIAYMEHRSGGLLDKSWFVSLQCPYPRMLREFADHSDITGREDILCALGHYIASLHQADILHLDLSIGNILFEKDETGIHFSLIDINRMKFCKIDQELGCKNFERLRGNTGFFKILADSYAQSRGFDPAYCLSRMLQYHEKSVEHFRKKREFKQRFRKKN